MMTRHKYWGMVEQDHAGFSPEIKFSHPFFEEQKVEIFLGEEYDEEGEEIDAPPGESTLDNYAETYKFFIGNTELFLKIMQEKSFERYTKYYAHYYENAEKSGQSPLNIDSVEKHCNAIRDIMCLRILDNETIKISIGYKLDTEHGLEFKFVGSELADVGGIAET